jgi:STE24 endopeptidase
MTAGLWITDMIKKIILSTVFGVIILIPLLFMLYNFKNSWWILLWVFFILFSLIIQIIYPLIIAPIFNRFKPLEDKDLQSKIEDLLLKTGFKFNGVFEMDASKRSSHSNAYFTGIGKSKRIVLFDVLLKNHTHEEILAILAHELGHYKHKHIIINFLISSVISFIGLFIAYLFLNYKPIYAAFGFSKDIDFERLKFIGLFLISILVGPIGFFLNPLTNILSRIFEYQADRYSVKIMNNSRFIIDALKKLSIQNLSNIYPSPLYAWFYYSHPPILARIKRLQSLENKND